MDPLSSIASIVSISEVLFKTAHTAAQVWRAPEALQRLSEEIQSLSTIATSLTQQNQDTRSQLLAAQSRLERINEKFKLRFCPGRDSGHLTPSVARRKWLTRRYTIEQLTKDVECIKNDLVLQVGLMILSTVQRKSKDDASLDTTDKSQRAYQVDGCKTTMLFEPSSSTCVPHFLQSGYSVLEIKEGTETCYFPASKISASVSQDLNSISPRGSLESSPNFFPEAYTTSKPSQLEMMVCSMTEVYRTLDQRVDHYHLLFTQDGRHWKRILVTASIALQISYPSMTVSDCWWSYTRLPFALDGKLRQLLRTTDMDNVVAGVNIRLESHEDGLLVLNESHMTLTQPRDTETKASMNAFDLIRTSRYQGLRQYLEGQVIPLKRRHFFFIVAIETELFIEIKLPFTSRPPQEDSALQTWTLYLQSLQSAQNCAGVATLEGIVVSHDRTRVHSFLIQAPRQGPLNELLYRTRQSGSPVSWERREKWIRQSLYALAQLHKRGIFGIFGDSGLDSYWVDADDNLKIVKLTASLSTHLHPDVIRSRLWGEVPPELLGHPSLKITFPPSNLSYQTDIFYLGCHMWRLLEYSAFRCEGICPVSVCVARSQSTEIAKVDLALPNPHLTDIGIADYISLIIGFCRQENPEARKPVSELISLLPPAVGLNQELPILLEYHAYHSRPDDPYCDICRKVIGHVQYRCHICNHNNFDLCSSCVDRGSTCRDLRHVLTRWLWKDGVVVDASPYKQTVIGKEQRSSETRAATEVQDTLMNTRSCHNSAGYCASSRNPSLEACHPP